MDRTTWLLLCRTVRFGDTDAAGVMHFHQLLRWCHEAYEESLERYGVAPCTVFPRPVWPGDQGDAVSVGLPIVHCRADYLRPLRVGDPLAISLEPRGLDPGQFEVNYSFRRDGTLVAQGLTRHLAITANERRRCALPEALRRWLEASGLGVGVREI